MSTPPAREPSIPGPFTRLERIGMRPIVLVSGALTLALGIALFVIDGQLREADGSGIVALEVAGSPGRASAILAEWGAGGIDRARMSLLVDFPFLISYGVLGAGLATASGKRLRALAGRDGNLARLGLTLYVLAPWVAWGFVFAAVFDLAENLALLRVLDYDLTPWATVAQAMAALKFGLLGAGAGYLLAAGALVLTRAGPSSAANSKPTGRNSVTH